MPPQLEPPSEEENRIEFRFSHAAGGDQALPASLLIQTLEGAQRAIWLLALAEEKRDIRTRARIPAELEQRYQLKCSIPHSGSYVLPAAIGPEQPPVQALIQASPGDTDVTGKVVDKFEQVARALVENQRDRLLDLMPDSAIRLRVLENFKTMAFMRTGVAPFR